MAVYNKFQDYAEQLHKAVHNWSSHTFKAAFTNSAPTATMTALSDITQISTGGGYTAGAGGGVTLSGVTLTETSGTAKVVISDNTFTASGASVGPFRYIVLYNDSATSPVDALVCWYDYGTSVTLASSESFTVDFDGSNGLFQFA
jgi:hypothetical protein